MPDHESEYDVAIVGLGPTGATLANLLCQCGISVLVLEREPAIYDLPRAVHFDDETMRVFQTVGIADALAQKVRVNPGMRFVDNDGNVILDWPRPQAISSHGWHASYRLHQPDLERLLREALAKQHDCTIFPGATLTTARQTSTTIELTYTHQGERKRTHAKYVVGCDGANSIIRQQMATGYDDLGFKERWLVVDVLLKQPLPSLGDHTLQFCDPQQPMTYCRNPRMRRRWEMALPEELSDEDAVDEQRIWQKLSRWISPDVATLERKAVYTFRSAVAGIWQQGRMLIAGDAAHLTPPFMGQGMCAGIRDASNLAWKLAAVIKKPQHHSLLDTYQKEREGHVREFIATAVKLGQLINSVDRNSPGTSDTNRQSSTMTTPTPAINTSMSSWLKLPPTDICGQLFTQPRLDNGQLLDDFIGYRFAVIGVKPMNSCPCLFIDAREHPVLKQLIQDTRTAALLIRPDRYIAYAAADATELPLFESAVDRLLL